MRGNRLERIARLQPGRSIPARAGEPGAATTGWTSSTVYPRACGGTSKNLLHLGREAGLSPRVRGNPVDQATAHEPAGSIPARAGEPGPSGVRNRATPVYPRACGGTESMPSCSRTHQGLSPRVRGNPKQEEQGIIDGRSIPARAGEPE